jgi:hypothetical protein
VDLCYLRLQQQALQLVLPSAAALLVPAVLVQQRLHAWPLHGARRLHMLLSCLKCQLMHPLPLLLLQQQQQQLQLVLLHQLLQLVPLHQVLPLVPLQ